MQTSSPFPNLARVLACACLAALLAGCGMKGPLRHPDPPPPADDTLATPPVLSPDTTPDTPSAPQS